MSQTNHNLDPMHELREQGVVHLKNIMSKAQLEILINEVNQITYLVNRKITKMQRPLRTFSDIAERQPGRLDFRCGFTNAIFKEIEIPIVNFIKATSPLVDFNYYWGAIPALSGAGPTDLHRDVYPVVNTCKGMDLSEYDIELPPYYFTVLLPLTEINQQSGPTQFIKQSHKHTQICDGANLIYTPYPTPGDALVFDGRTMHRGCANQSTTTRQIAYLTFIAKWYHDQTFTINDFLFPELQA